MADFPRLSNPDMTALVNSEIVDNDAVEIGALYQKAGRSLVDSVKYQIECGQRLTEKKATMKHGQWLPWLDSNLAVLGFSTRQTAAKLMKTVANGTSTLHLDPPEAVKISRQTWGNSTTRATAQTGDNEWFTPTEILDAAREVLGQIDLDPASDDVAQDQVMAARYFTAEDNGLEREWNGRIWLNPPYAQPLIAQFISKLIEERNADRVTAVIMLTNNSTDTVWWHEAANESDAVCFTRGRIQFYKPAGGPSAPLQGQTFFYFGDDVEAFTARFQKIGYVMELIR